jgi:acetyltransferase-like isoleucine patch superfamily enzyme
MIICLTLPIRITFWLLNLLGHKVHSRCRIGFSIIWINGNLILENDSRIGHFNLISIDGLSIGEHGYIGNLNALRGPFNVELARMGAIGNNNKCSRAPLGVTYGRAVLKLGILAKITSSHRVDCTRSVVLGDYTTVAGHNSQLWTHAYYHDKKGPGRFRLDGDIVIGNNVYIGSQSVINCGVTIVDGVVVGSNSSVSKSLLLEGNYVSQPLRFIESVSDSRSKFKKIDAQELVEDVYERNK